MLLSRERTIDLKIKCSPLELFKDSFSRQLVPLLEEASSLEFSEKPNYGKLKFLLEKILLENDKVPNSQYSFLGPPSIRHDEKDNSGRDEISSEDLEDYEVEQMKEGSTKPELEKWDLARQLESL